MRLIDADKLLDEFYRHDGNNWTHFDWSDLSCPSNVYTVIENVINEQPTVDAVEIVRCKDCEHRDENCCIDGDIYCDIVRGYMAQDDYCIYGERREK